MDKIKIYDWYKKEFPTDELAEEINKDITFKDLFIALDTYKDIYEFLNVYDSIIRERCFGKLSELMDVDYDYIYYKWLNS